VCMSVCVCNVCVCVCGFFCNGAHVVIMCVRYVYVCVRVRVCVVRLGSSL